MSDLILRYEAQRHRALDLIGGLNLDKPWRVTIKPYRKRRSLSQNGLYWMQIGSIANATGNAKEAVHEAFKGMFCPAKMIVLGDEERLVRSTTLLSSAEMSEYMKAVEAHAASELGVFVPLPEEMHLREMA